MPIPVVAVEQFKAAFETFDRDYRPSAGWSSWESDPNHKYAILFEGRRYPVKQLIAMATGASKDTFSGGEEANGYLYRLGLVVISLKDGLPVFNRIQACLREITCSYLNARLTGPFSANHRLNGVFDALKNVLAESEVVGRYPHLRIIYSLGKGNWAHQPWLVLMDDRETNRASSGVLCGILFDKDMQGFRLDLSQGTSGVTKDQLQAKAQSIREELPELFEKGFQNPESVAASKDDYLEGVVVLKAYQAEDIPSDRDFLQDLASLLESYEQYVERHHPTRAYWIFQANPDQYDLRSAVTSLQELGWQARQHADKIRAGDAVFLWESGPQGGVVALANVLTDPQQLPPDPADTYWRTESNGEFPRVRLHVDTVYNPLVARSVILQDPVVGGSSFFKMNGRGTNFPVTPEEAEALLQLLNKVRIPRYWKISPGEGAAYWPQCREGGYISLGWDDFGDLSGLSEEQFYARLTEIQQQHPDWGYTKQGCRQLWTFSQIQPGDIIVANQGQKVILGIGRVTGPYYFEPEAEHAHRLPVDWFDLSPRSVNEPSWLQTVIELTHSRYQALIGNQKAEPMPNIPAEKSTDLYEHFQRRGFWFSDETITNYALSLKTKPFVILTGISGTGKTKIAQVFAEFMCPDELSTRQILPQNTDSQFFCWPDPFFKRDYLYLEKKVQQYFDIPNRGLSTEIPLKIEGAAFPTVRLSNINFSDPSAAQSIRLYFKKEAREWILEQAKTPGYLRFESIDGTLHLNYVRAIEHLDQSDRYAFISVRPDWTDNRGLLGYYNPLTEQYVPTELLRLMLRAAADPARPYFVILDEMNLAKVEHYFSDFLSCLESRRMGDNGITQEGILLHDRAEAIPFEDESGHRNEIPRKFDIPLNLYFTGTVNIDETTYMFSPKVLDRANVLEFNHVDLDRYGNVGGAVEQEVSTFRLTEVPSLGQPSVPTKDIYEKQGLNSRQVLADLNRLLTPYNLHFGYRVANEIALYLQNARELIGPSAEAIALDLQILQKVLPKLHGSRAKLEKPLQQLLAYLVIGNPQTPEQALSWFRDNEKHLETTNNQHLALRKEVTVSPVTTAVAGEGTVATVEKTISSVTYDARYPRAAAKVYRMIQALREQGYASFIV